MDLAEATRVFKTTLAGYDGFWCVAGGWAIDLYLDRQTRNHEDLEIVVLRDEAEKLFRHFDQFNPQKIISGETPQFIPWRGEAIDPNVIQMRLAAFGRTDFDLLLSPSEKDEWICRRAEDIRLPLNEVSCLSLRGIPVLKPEIVLLFKAKYLREKDLSDYHTVVNAISPHGRQWLSKSLGQVHPDHPWA